jgi:hypothetical protein
MAQRYAHEGRKLQITKHKCEEINKNNRDLRVQIKSMLKDNPSAGGKVNATHANTKRELIK